MEWLIIGGVLLLVLAKRSSGAAAAGVPYPEASSPTPADPAAIDQFNDALSNHVAVDIQSGNARNLTIGETAIAAGIGAVSMAAGQTATGTILLTATSWTIVGGIVAAAFTLVTMLRSTTHLYANELVENYENPFGQYFIQAIQTVDGGFDGLSSEDIKGIANALAVAWHNYRVAMLDLMTRGRDWEIVAKQSLNNLNNEFEGQRLPNGKVLGKGMGGQYPDGFITQWMAWLDNRVQFAASLGR